VQLARTWVNCHLLCKETHKNCHFTQAATAGVMCKQGVNIAINIKYLKLTLSFFIIILLSWSFILYMKYSNEQMLIQALETAEIKEVIGKVHDVKKFNAFLYFKIENLKFRVPYEGNACVVAKKQIVSGAVLEIKYANIGTWPDTKSDHFCVISSKYISGNKPRAGSGQSANNKNT